MRGLSPLSPVGCRAPLIHVVAGFIPAYRCRLWHPLKKQKAEPQVVAGFIPLQVSGVYPRLFLSVLEARPRLPRSPTPVTCSQSLTQVTCYRLEFVQAGPRLLLIGLSPTTPAQCQKIIKAQIGCSWPRDHSVWSRFLLKNPEIYQGGSKARPGGCPTSMKRVFCQQMGSITLEPRSLKHGSAWHMYRGERELHDFPLSMP